MALISQNFKSTTVGNAIDVIPIVVLAEKNTSTNKYEIIDSFSTRHTELKDEEGNNIYPQDIIKTISGVKNSIDLERKNIRINTFRFSLYNYYDVVRKYADSPQFNLIGKSIILYYKTNTTSQINLNTNIESLEDEDCSIIFYGIVSRLTQSGDTISIQAEDSTQDYIKDKQVPTKKIADLDSKIKDGIADRDDEKPIPMVFGKVDKATTITYQTNLSNSKGFKSLGMIHDSREISSNFSTSKVPPHLEPYHLYLQDDDDWVAFPYQTTFVERDSEDLAQTFFVDPQVWVAQNQQIVPETEDIVDTPIFCIGYTFPVDAITDLSGENKLDSLSGTIQDSNLSANTEPLSYNYGYNKKWKRADDFADNMIAQGESLEAQPINYINASANDGLSRWVLVKLDKEKVLFRIYLDGTLFAALDDNGVPTENPNSDTFMLHAVPFNPDFYKALIESNKPEKDYHHYFINPHDLDDTHEEVGSSGFNLPVGDNERSFTSGKIKDHYDTNENNAVTNFFNHHDARKSFEESKAVNRVLFFERKDEAEDNDNDISIGWRLSNTSFLYAVEKSGYETETFHASIEGRKDYTSTENITNLTELLEEYNLTPYEAAVGNDGNMPDFELLINGWDDYFEDMYTNWSGVPRTTFLNNELMDKIKTDFAIQPNLEFPDLEYKTSSQSDSSFMHSHQVVHSIIHGLVKKFYINVIDDIIFNEEGMLDDASTFVDDYVNLSRPLNNFELGESTYHTVLGWALLSLTENYVNSGQEQWVNLLISKIQEYSTHRRALLRRIFKYLYQDNLNDESNIDSLFSGYQYEWDSFDIDVDSNQGAEDLANNITLYLDDTINTINKSILDSHSEHGTGYGDDSTSGSRNELYIWDDNPEDIGGKRPHLVQLYKYIN